MNKNKAHEVFLTFLKKGYRITPQRFEVLDNALDINTHFTADQLYNKMRKNKSTVSRATVYNTKTTKLSRNSIIGFSLIEEKRLYLLPLFIFNSSFASI